MPLPGWFSAQSFNASAGTRQEAPLFLARVPALSVHTQPSESHHPLQFKVTASTGHASLHQKRYGSCALSGLEPGISPPCMLQETGSRDRQGWSEPSLLVANPCIRSRCVSRQTLSSAAVTTWLQHCVLLILQQGRDTGSRAWSRAGRWHKYYFFQYLN